MDFALHARFCRNDYNRGVLVEEIPQIETYLVKSLTKLAWQFQVEQILNLVERRLTNDSRFCFGEATPMLSPIPKK